MYSWRGGEGDERERNELPCICVRCVSYVDDKRAGFLQQLRAERYFTDYRTSPRVRRLRVS